MDQINMSLEALKLSRAGYVVMPVQQNKRPYSEFPWKFLQKASRVTDDQVKRWWMKYKGSNIAMITGNKVFAVDCDNQDAIDLVVKHLPETPAVSITGKGKHFLYRMPAFNIGNSVNKETGIDIRGYAGYIVAPPSVHENGNRYTWENGFLDPVNIPELQPSYYEILYELTKNKSFEEFIPKKEVSFVVSKQAPVKNQEEHRDLNPLFREILTKIQKLTRNGENSYKGCCPAHNDRNPSFTVTLDQSTGNILMKCFSGCSFENICDSLGVRQTDLISEKPNRVVIQENGNNPINRQPGKETVIKDDLIANDEECQAPDFPEKWMRPPGLVGEIIDYINDTAIRPQPLLALGAALTAVGTLFGRKVQSQTGSRTNLYIVGVAKTGAGKERPRKAIRKIFKSSGVLPDYIGGEQFASDTGILVEVENHPSILYMVDEFGKYLQTIKGATNQSHLSNIITLLMSIYEKADDSFIWKQYADKKRERIIIDQPNVSIFGTTVSTNFWEGFTTQQAIDGFLNRILIIQTDKVPRKRKEIYQKDVPSSIVEQVIKAHDMSIYRDQRESPMNKAISIDPNDAIPEPKIMFYDEEAQSIMDDFDEKIENKTISNGGEDSIENAMWRRTFNNAEKIALTIAAGSWKDKIDAESALFGINIASCLTEISLYNVKRHVADNAIEQNVLKILSIIKDYGKAGATKSQITRRTQGLSKMMRDDALQTLIDGEKILCEESKVGKTLPTMRFFPKKGG